jgi:pyrroloquinoline quinone (PQQ) biosynthesis protein C
MRLKYLKEELKWAREHVNAKEKYVEQWLEERDMKMEALQTMIDEAKKLKSKIPQKSRNNKSTKK